VCLLAIRITNNKIKKSVKKRIQNMLRIQVYLARNVPFRRQVFCCYQQQIGLMCDNSNNNFFHPQLRHDYKPNQRQRQQQQQYQQYQYTQQRDYNMRTEGLARQLIDLAEQYNDDKNKKNNATTTTATKNNDTYGYQLFNLIQHAILLNGGGGLLDGYTYSISIHRLAKSLKNNNNTIQSIENDPRFPLLLASLAEALVLSFSDKQQQQQQQQQPPKQQQQERIMTFTPRDLCTISWSIATLLNAFEQQKQQIQHQQKNNNNTSRSKKVFDNNYYDSDDGNEDSILTLRRNSVNNNDHKISIETLRPNNQQLVALSTELRHCILSTPKDILTNLLLMSSEKSSTISSSSSSSSTRQRQFNIKQTPWSSLVSQLSTSMIEYVATYVTCDILDNKNDTANDKQIQKSTTTTTIIISNNMSEYSNLLWSLGVTSKYRYSNNSTTNDDTIFQILIETMIQLHQKELATISSNQNLNGKQRSVIIPHPWSSALHSVCVVYLHFSFPFWISSGQFFLKCF
jgi:hypothetical protein